MFEVGRKLGRGKFGDVYMCRETLTGFACAIKMINKSEVKSAGMESQLIQQIKIQLYSNHPNILKMYGFFHDSTKIYLLLELATNGCLFKQIRKRSNFEQNLASFYFRQVVSGVRFLHSNYVIHRDIKPQNILNSFNVLKICDFGWAIYSPLQYILFYLVRGKPFVGLQIMFLLKLLQDSIMMKKLIFGVQVCFAINLQQERRHLSLRQMKMRPTTKF